MKEWEKTRVKGEGIKRKEKNPEYIKRREWNGSDVRVMHQHWCLTHSGGPGISGALGENIQRCLLVSASSGFVRFYETLFASVC